MQTRSTKDLITAVKDAPYTPLTRRERRQLRKRGISPQHCARKVRHATKAAADVAALRLGWQYHVVECPFCKGWHVNSGR